MNQLQCTIKLEFVIACVIPILLPVSNQSYKPGIQRLLFEFVDSITWYLIVLFSSFIESTHAISSLNTVLSGTYLSMVAFKSTKSGSSNFFILDVQERLERVMIKA